MERWERRERRQRQPERRTPGSRPTELTYQRDRYWRFLRSLRMKNRERQIAQALERNLVSAFFEYTLSEQVLHFGQRFIDHQLGVTPVEGFTRFTEFRGYT